jgi:hypothetical protein
MKVERLRQRNQYLSYLTGLPRERLTKVCPLVKAACMPDPMSHPKRWQGDTAAVVAPPSRFNRRCRSTPTAWQSRAALGSCLIRMSADILTPLDLRTDFLPSSLFYPSAVIITHPRRRPATSLICRAPTDTVLVHVRKGHGAWYPAYGGKARSAAVAPRCIRRVSCVPKYRLTIIVHHPHPFTSSLYRTTQSSLLAP